MKIGELQDHCGNCNLIDYCTEPYETPHLCACEELEDVDEETYRQIAEGITEEEIKDKLRQYEESNISPWDNEYNGAICDIVLEKRKGEIQIYKDSLVKEMRELGAGKDEVLLIKEAVIRNAIHRNRSPKEVAQAIMS